MDRTRIDEVGIAELPDAPESLEGARIDQGNLEFAQVDVAVDRVGDHLSRGQHGYGQAPRSIVLITVAVETLARHSGR